MVRDRHIDFSERAQAHWIWVIGALLVPFALLLVSMLGMPRGSFVSTEVAAAVPLVALVLSLGVLGIALAMRRRAAIAVTVAGVVLTVLGVLWLRWVGAP